MARIANGEPFAIYNGTTFTAEADGRLSLGINDVDYSFGDNGGTFRITIWPTTSNAFAVPGDQAWTDTGIDVGENTTVRITASGLITIAFTGFLNMQPEGYGWDSGYCDQNSPWLEPGFDCYSLIGRIGTGPTFSIRSGTTVEVVAGGRLYLGVNDEVGAYGDNSGAWNVVVDADDIASPPTLTPSPTVTITPSCAPGPNEVAVFSETGYTGVCETYPVGNYWNLSPPGYSFPGDAASSVLVGSEVRAILYLHSSMYGGEYYIETDQPDLGHLPSAGGGFFTIDDQVSSLQVHRKEYRLGGGCTSATDEIVLYQRQGFRGDCITMGLGEYANLVAAFGLYESWTETLLSVDVGADVEVQVCDRDDFAGDCTWFAWDDANVLDNGLNYGSLKSVRVRAATGTVAPPEFDGCNLGSREVAIWVEPDYGGFCTILVVGRYENPPHGLPHDSMGSVKIGADVRLRICDEPSFVCYASAVFTADDASTYGDGGEWASSFAIEPIDPVPPESCVPNGNQAAIYQGYGQTETCMVVEAGEVSTSTIGWPESNIRSIWLGSNVTARLCNAVNDCEDYQASAKVDTRIRNNDADDGYIFIIPTPTPTEALVPTNTPIPTATSSPTPSPMPVVVGLPLIEDFESGSLARWAIVASLVVEPTDDPFGGGFNARMTTTGAPSLGTLELEAPQPALFVQVRFLLASQGDDRVTLLALRDADGALIAGVGIGSTGRLQILNGATNDTVDGGPTVTAGEWHEMQLRVDQVTGLVETWYDGQRIDVLSGAHPLGDTPIGRVQLGEHREGRIAEVRYDDLSLATSLIPTTGLYPAPTPTSTPTKAPTATSTPTAEPTAADEPTNTPTEEPTPALTTTLEPTSTPTEEPPVTATPTEEATATEEPTPVLTATEEATAGAS